MKRAALIAVVLLPTIGHAKPVATPPPVIQLNVPAPQAEQFGDWKLVYLDDGFRATATENQAGRFGVLCGPSSCSAFFTTKAKCDDNSTYPGMVNSPGGAFNVKFVCSKAKKADNDDSLLFPFDPQVVRAFTTGGTIGIAFPMASGSFQVTRFSLTGALASSLRLAEITGQALPKEGADPLPTTQSL